MISSVKNPKVQRIRALQGRVKERREAQAFVAEGVRLAEEVLASGWPVQQVFYTQGLDERGRIVLSALVVAGAAVEEVSPAVMEACSDTKTPQGILLEVAKRSASMPAAADLVLILDGVSDPGNVGTLLRSAAAAGADAAVLAPGSADPFAPKVLRSGMGAQFHLAVLELNWEQITSLLAKYGLQAFVAQANRGESFDQVNLTQKLAFIVGGEAHGPSAAALASGARPVHIPMPGRAESLNAATAGSLLLFEAVRQRRGAE